MIRKNLIVFYRENEGTLEDEISISNDIPGCLDIDESLGMIKNAVTKNYNFIDMAQDLTKLRNNSKIYFRKADTFMLDSCQGGAYEEDGERLPIYDNIYLINITNRYQCLKCETEFVDSSYNGKDGGIYIEPKSIMVLSLKECREYPTIKYNIIHREGFK